MDPEVIAHQIVDSAIKVHKTLGPGLLESVYQSCLYYELEKRGLHVKTEIPQPVHYDALELDVGYRIDMLVEDSIVIENKTVDQILPIHAAQMLTYLKLSGKSLGFLINWNVPLLKNGIKRMVNNYQSPTKIIAKTPSHEEKL